MFRADGVTLESMWPLLSVDQNTSIQGQLNSIFTALRSTPFPPGQAKLETSAIKFGSFVSATCKGMRRQARVSKVPITSEAEFNDFLCHRPGRPVSSWAHMIRSAMQDNHALVMTHADLHQRNIMVKWEDPTAHEEGRGIRITVLIDWELSGWYPEYWEFVKALSTASMRGELRDWPEYLPTDAIGKWPVEYALDSLLARWLG
jgi:hypothetical protein